MLGSTPELDQIHRQLGLWRPFVHSRVRYIHNERYAKRLDEYGWPGLEGLLRGYAWSYCLTDLDRTVAVRILQLSPCERPGSTELPAVRDFTLHVSVSDPDRLVAELNGRRQRAV